LPLPALLERAVATASDGIAIYAATEDGALVYANAAFHSLLAETPTALAERSLLTVFDDDYAKHALHGALRSESACTVPAKAQSQCPPGRPVVLSLSPVRDASGVLTHWWCTLREGAAEHECARTRSEHERLEAVTLLAAGLAHEINNPLASITTNLEWLVATLPTLRPSQPAVRGNQAPALSAALVDALAGAERIEAAIRQLHALTGVQHEAHELLDVRVLLDAALHEIEPLLSAGIDVRRDYAEIPLVLGGQGRLRHAFAQLLSNAAQAITPDCARRVIDLRVSERASTVRIEIDDSGSGVAPHVHDDLFRPFVTTKPLGLGKGLGLYLARSSIEAAGGKIAFEALSGGGTRFFVELPGVQTRTRSALDSTADLESIPPTIPPNE
jgi:signal transduction histidine kinase